MARQRFIKPAFFLHGELFDAEQASGLPLRVAFSGLWTQADRRGVFRCKPRELKAAVLPYDAVDMDQVITALEQAGFIKTYVVDGKRYGHIPTLADHQTFHRDERPSNDPGPEAAQGQHGVDTVPAQGQHADPTLPYPTTVAAAVSGDFGNADHAAAAEGFLRAARNPQAVKASIRAVAVGVPGHGPGFGWPVVGQALLELAAAGSPFSEQGLRAFARKVRDRKPERPKIELVTDDLGRNRPAIREGAGWKYLTDDEARAMGWTGSAA